MKIHGLSISPNVRKVLVALNIKGLEFELIRVFPGTKTPEFLEISPLGLIPALEDGEFAFSDSGIILEYLDEKYPDNPLMPSSLEGRARSRWFSEYGGSAVFPCCAPIFQQRVVNPFYEKKPTDESIVEKVMNEKFPPVLTYLESQVPNEGYFFDELGAADISIVSPILNAEYGQFRIDESRWPKLASFVKRVKSHPAVRPCLELDAAVREALISGAA